MQISNLKTLAIPSLNDVLPILDINGGVSGKPILRKATLSSIFSLIEFPENSGGSSSGLVVPNVIKTIAENSDYFIGIDNGELPYKISKSNLLAGVGVGGGGSSAYPNRFTHWHDESVVIAGAALVADYSSTNPYGITSYQPSNAVGDSFSFDVFTEAGTYGVTFLGHAYTNRGLASISVNGTLQYSDLDFYGFNTIVKLNRNIVMPVTGRNTVTVTVVGKNSGSSAFYVTLTKVWGIKL